MISFSLASFINYYLEVTLVGGPFTSLSGLPTDIRTLGSVYLLVGDFERCSFSEGLPAFFSKFLPLR